MAAFCVPPGSLSARPRQPALSPVRARAGDRALPRAAAAASPDVVIVGAGVAGLSTAFELVQRGATVRVITAPQRRPAARAAAGMLAPSSEPLSGPLLTLAEHSLRLYPSFVRNLHAISGQNVQFVSRSDFLVPYFENTTGDHLIQADAVRLIEPALGPNVVAVRRHPGDASVDNRRMLNALRVACEKLGVTFSEVPVRTIVASCDSPHIAALESETGERIHAAHFVVAAGAWTKKLLPMVPVRPVKGQMISLAPPPSSYPLLNHVIHSSKLYIVPKNHLNEYYVGATMEECGFDARNTPAGVKQLIDAAIDLVPAMADYEIRDMWTGFRPTTPDEAPIFGPCTFDNLTVSTGFYRNGILLAPIAAKIAAAYAQGQIASLPSDLQHVLDKFTIERFYTNNISNKTDVTSTLYQPSEAADNIRPPVGSGPSSLNTEQPHSIGQIKLWKILPDGTNEPVYPPGWKAQKNKPSPEFSLSINSSEGPLPQTPSAPSIRNEVTPPSQPAESQKFEAVSAVNDAYDDILHKRGPGMQESMSNALAQNRAFGRKPCSLQREDGPVLSISEDDVKRCDAAAEMGYRDMQELEKCFDPKHGSVIATRTETGLTDTDGISPKVFVGGVELAPPTAL